MAENVYKHSKHLFTKENEPILFFLRPCPDKSKINPLVEYGGGKVLSKFVTGAIKLAQDGDYVSSGDYISTKYVLDCVKNNHLMDTEKYKMKRQGSKKFSVDNAEELSNVSDDLSPSSSVYIEAKDIKGRTKYTDEEDVAMLSYIVTEHRQNAIHGNQLYKDMQVLKITKHTAPSMNSRMRKCILPNISKYNIPKKWKKIFSEKVSPKKDNTLTLEQTIKIKENITNGKPKIKPTSDLSEEIDSFITEDDFDQQLKSISKGNVNSTPNKELQVNLSKSVVPSDNQQVVTDTRDCNLNNTNEAGSDECSDEELDASLIRYQNNEEESTSTNKNRKSRKRLRKKTDGTPNKKTEQTRQSNENKKSRTRYILDDEDNTEDTSDDEVKINEVTDDIQNKLKIFGETYGLLQEEVLYLLQQHDGCVQETILFIESGKSKLTWELDDDKHVENNSSMDKLTSKYGESRVRLRAAFLEAL
ncbi:telomeric repeat-binding factor 2-interacting protein 1-like isoform X1 [Mytilus trossulus]|uniref:telomeric repeat-binding factor 2-interacting protein 1-like isoform X1 n=2 Tax=Mytilus trossulus TaxID=6551 RepID=UPI0030041AC5